MCLAAILCNCAFAPSADQQVSWCACLQAESGWTSMYNQYGAAWQADNLGAPPYDVRITPRDSAPLVASCGPMLPDMRNCQAVWMSLTFGF